MSWAPPQKHSVLDPVGCVTALSLIAELDGCKTKGWMMPYSNNTLSEITAQNLDLLPRIGSYQMKKVCTKDVVVGRYKCEFCSRDYKLSKSLGLHHLLKHSETEVCF